MSLLESYIFGAIQPSTGFIWIRANDGELTFETYYKLVGLNDDVDYQFRVAAENRAGLGPFSDVSMPVKAYQQMGKIQ